MSEGRPDPPQLPGIKVLESLKKHLLESTESPRYGCGDESAAASVTARPPPSKPLSSREVCSSFSDLVEAVYSAAQRYVWDCVICSDLSVSP